MQHWIAHYPRANFKHDVMAGITVGVIMIPQAMAYAMLAGLPPVYGLYASTIPLVMYALLGTSRHLSVGPVAIDSIMVATGIGVWALAGSEDYIALAILLAFMVGLIQLSLGLSRLGFLIHFLSRPVIQGFVSAAAILIALSQLKHILRIELKSNMIFEDIIRAFTNPTSIHLLTVSIGIAAVIMLGFLKKYLPAFPGPLLIVILSTVLVYLFNLELAGVRIVGDIPSGFPAPGIPLIHLPLMKQLLPTAFAIALVSFMESNAVAKAIQERHKNYQVNPDRELIALGMANLAGSFFKSFPVSGGFSRSVVNDQAGARTSMSSVVTAFLVVITLLFLTPLFYYLPIVVLAAIIIVMIYKLINLQEAKYLWSVDKRDFLMMMVTFLGTLFLGIGTGIGIGVLLSLAWILYETSYPHYAELGRIPGTHSFRNVKRFDDLETDEDVLIFRFDAPLYFANINRFKQVLYQYKMQRKSLRAVVVDMESINMVDSTAVRVLGEIIDEMHSQRIMVLFTELKGPVRDKFHKSGLIKKAGVESFFLTIEEAVTWAGGNQPDFSREMALQRNK